VELHEALTQITHIRAQMARSEVFRGFRAVPVAFSGLLALAAAGFQAAWVADPVREISSYLVLWVSVALVSLAATGTEMVLRSRRSSSPLRREITWLTIEQFLPSVAAGALMTFVIVSSAPKSVWLLPGLWQVLFSLGIFASHRLLPRPIFWVAVFYMLCGTLCLAMGKESFALAPLAMGIPFGVGQLAAAAVLYWTLERGHEPT
jgi:hypothetical protein